ncbi:hypothetical protein [Streptomyces litchfieldiae]|uniref:Protein kilB n=1 Tax=Streptomyces litchfieldiae TaxID=3075543 RepID=A0ABU2N0V5_9ACTN|nr:hypothetical protein [Streptomyces sp. DSM 44938]MDT0347542.1 hypothetical protein [Streptomyces sp. DSM 44938]
MWTTLIAVLGTLGGAVTTGLVQHLADRSRKREHARRDLADAIEGLLAAIVTHREQRWLRVAATREARPDSPEARERRYAARSQVTRARDRLAMTTNDAELLAAAQAAIDTTNALGDIALGTVVDGRFAPEIEQALRDARDVSRQAHTALRELGAARVHA